MEILKNIFINCDKIKHKLDSSNRISLSSKICFINKDSLDYHDEQMLKNYQIFSLITPIPLASEIKYKINCKHEFYVKICVNGYLFI